MKEVEAVIPEKAVVHISNEQGFGNERWESPTVLNATIDSSCLNLALLRKPVVALALFMQERYYNTQE